MSLVLVGLKVLILGESYHNFKTYLSPCGVYNSNGEDSQQRRIARVSGQKGAESVLCEFEASPGYIVKPQLKKPAFENRT